jgi:hypothetical protein
MLEFQHLEKINGLLFATDTKKPHLTGAI